MDYSEDLKRTLQLADLADEIGMKYFLHQDLKVQTKLDNTPVTQADTETEEILSKIVIEEFGDSYVGEEGTKNEGKKRRWLVDPIDGTKNFVRGMPVWGSLISLKDGEEIVVASVSMPALGRRWWAFKEAGAFTRDISGRIRQIQVSNVTNIPDAFLLHSSLNTWDEIDVGSDKVVKLVKSAWRERALGDFWNHMLVAEGIADAAMEYGPKLWDIEAPAFIVQQAGGVAWNNADQNFRNEDSRIFITANKHLLEPVLKALGLT